MLDEIRIALRCTHFSFVRFGALLTLSKNEPHQQISGIVSCGIASGAVVIGSSAIESRIGSVLDREIDVLLRPPRKIEQVSIALRTAIRAARNRSLGKQQWVGRSGHIKVADRARKTRAEMIFNISLHSVEVVAGHSGSALSKARDQRRVLANIRPPERQNIILPSRDGSVVLEIEGPISVAVQTRDILRQRTVYDSRCAR